MLKKIVGIMLCVTMLSLNVFADEPIGNAEKTEVESEEAKVYTFSLEDAINIAIDNSPQLKACAVKKDDNKIQLKAAKETKSQYRDVNSIYMSAYEIYYIKKGYYVHAYQKALELSDYEYKQIEAQISYDVTQKYFTVKNCEKLVQIAENSYNIVLDNYNNAKLSYELGLISQSEFDSAKVSLMQAEFTVSSYKNNFEIAKENFKISLRKNDENCDFVLTSELDVKEFETNLAEDLITAENSRYDIAALKSNYELEDEYLSLTLGAATSRYSSAYSSFITAEYNYTNNKSLILLGIKSSYNNISATRNNVTLAEETLKLKNNAYNIAKVQFEQGMITNSELLSAQNAVYSAEVEYENAKLNYNLAVDKYKYDVEIGL